MADILNANYREIYKEVNQVSRPIPTRQCSRVMTVHRMYFRLDDLAVTGLNNPEVVEELYVFADVVEVEGNELQLPGSRQVSIVCRVLRANSNTALIRLPSLQPVRCGISSDSTVYPELAGVGMRVTILAAHLQLPINAAARFRVLCPIIVTRLTYDPPGGGFPTPVFTESPGTAEWSISRYDINGVAASRDVVPIAFDQTRFLGFEPHWRPIFRVALPESIPPELLANSNISLGVEATTLVSELVLTYQREATETVTATLHHINWLDNQLVSASEQGLHTELHFRVQALLKLHINTEQEGALIVPALRYDLYDNLISLMARVAESYDTAFRDFNLFIQQNEILGEFLLEQNKAFAQRERDMESHHSQLVTLRESELRATNEKINNLQTSFHRQNEAMDKAQADMEAGLTEYRNQLIADAVFGVLGAVFQVGLAFATGGATLAGAAVANARRLSQLARVLQDVVVFLERLEKIKDVLNAVTDFLSTLSHLDQLMNLPEMPDMPAAAEWYIFENEIEAVAEGMPAEVSEVPVWKAKCKNVAALGREITTTVAAMTQLQYELGVNKMLQDVAKKQAERLEGLEIRDLDNYLEMASEMDMRTNRMLMGLLHVLRVQTGALSYYYLLAPRPFSGWVRMEAVWNVMLRNEADKLAALISLGPSTDTEMTYVVNNIPVGLLLAGEDWIFDILVSDPAFSNAWSKVRIEYVELRFPSADDDVGHHRPNTRSGEVYMLLQAGQFFNDRRRGDVFHYQASVPTVYQYAYRLDTGETTVSNRPSVGSATQFMRMTPFTRWRLRLSASAPQNAELVFPTATTGDATTQITITFHLTVIRQPYQAAAGVDDHQTSDQLQLAAA